MGPASNEEFVGSPMLWATVLPPDHSREIELRPRYRIIPHCLVFGDHVRPVMAVTERGVGELPESQSLSTDFGWLHRPTVPPFSGTSQMRTSRCRILSGYTTAPRGDQFAPVTSLSCDCL